jgi:FdhD protein
VAIEEPLEIRVEGQAVAVTMRTPGHDRELAAGFLLTEGVLEHADDLSALGPIGASGNVVDVRLAAGVEAHRAALDRATRDLYATSSCGICGKASIDRVRIVARVPIPDLALDGAFVHALPARLRAAQAGFRATGGLHGAALVRTDGTVEVVREDVGRHNAVDKVLGWRLLDDRIPIADAVLVVSSRAGFEIVQKARVAGVGAVVALGAATTLAVDLAADVGIALYGFVTADRYNRYT